MTATKERPILFSSPMVNAIREGHKTQTRRVIKGEWTFDGDESGCGYEPPSCPYGVPGDRLWVREAWAGNGYDIYGNALPVSYRAEATKEEVAARSRLARSGEMLPWRSPIHMPRWAARILLEITDVRVERLWDITEADAIAEGARGWLDSLDGRAYDSAEKQACRFAKIIDPQARVMSHRGVFAALWESINGKDSWAANPWLWTITFRRIDA